MSSPFEPRRWCAALILAGAAPLALAQPASGSVTIYGKVDLGLVRTSNHPNSLPYLNGSPVGGAGVWSLSPGSYGVLGFRGVEDLGGGYRARFKLQQEFNPDTGSLRTTTTFSRTTLGWWGESTVGLDTPFGSLDLGRAVMAPGAVAFLADPFYWDTVGQVSGYIAPNGYAPNDVVKYNNGVFYQSPNFSGFSTRLGYGFGEGTNPNGNSTDATRGKGYGGNIIYAKGPIWVGIALDVHPTTATRDTEKQLAGTYDLGFAKLMASTSRSKVGNVSKGFWSAGARIPAGSGVVKVVHMVGNPRNFTFGTSTFLQTRETSKSAIGYDYMFSRRTKLYVDFAAAKPKGLDRITAYDFGLSHSF